MKALVKIIVAVLFVITNIQANHPESGVNPTKHYTDAYEALKAMLEGQAGLNFRDAVFITENAWHDDSLSYSAYRHKLQRMLRDVAAVREQLTFDYPHSDKYNVYTNAALFKYFTDTIGYGTSNSVFGYKYPFTYTSDDPLVEKDWTTMFVTKLMETNQGNCHSLPYLYRILAHEFQVSASLVIAPNHIYITHLCHDPKVTWYNTELTSGTHPTDSWISIKTYMSMEGIRNGIYGLPLNEKQSVALCLVDLANGYLRKFPERDHQFTIQCLNMALKYFPNCINALLLKLDVLSKAYQQTKDENFKYEIDRTAQVIHELGYDEMPHQMYKDWLTGAKDTIKEHKPYKNVNQAVGATSLDNGKSVLTASGGRYLEGHWTDSLEQIGNVLYDTKHKRVAQFLPIDTTDVVSRTPKDLPCRWLSPDPLAGKYPNLSPYHFSGNNPVVFVDYDGRDFGIKIDHDAKTMIIVVDIYTIGKNTLNVEQATKGAQLWNAQKYEIEGYAVTFDIKVHDASDKLQMSYTDFVENAPASIKKEFTETTKKGKTSIDSKAASNLYERYVVGSALKSAKMENAQTDATGNIYRGRYGGKKQPNTSPGRRMGTINGNEVFTDWTEVNGVERDFASGPYTFAHEIAHLMGLDDLTIGLTTTLGDYYSSDGIMSYQNRFTPPSENDVRNILKYAVDALNQGSINDTQGRLPARVGETNAKVTIEEKGNGDFKSMKIGK